MLAIRDLAKTYRTGKADNPAVRGVSFDVPRGTFFTLLGPSGCGKTTILHSIAGLETPDGGEIEIDGVLVFSASLGRNEPPSARRLGMVFQSYAIWPHMTVFENVAFPLLNARPRMSRSEIQDRVLATLRIVQLNDLAEKLAPFLSGGQQQRVALARALVHEPKLLLLDEPLSNLDAKLREEMRLEIRRLVRDLGITAVFVTHDQSEALAMSDSIALLSAGRIVQQGSPHDIYYRPNSAFAARFIGGGSIIPGEVVSPPDHQGTSEIDTPFGRMACAVPEGMRAGSKVNVIIRPESLRVHNGHAPPPGRNVFQINVSQTRFVGDFMEGVARSGDSILSIRLPAHTPITAPLAAVVEVIPDRCVVLPHKE